eukprot:6488871-Amphidinium_carterae.3
MVKLLLHAANVHGHKCVNAEGDVVDLGSIGLMNFQYLADEASLIMEWTCPIWALCGMTPLQVLDKFAGSLLRVAFCVEQLGKLVLPCSVVTPSNPTQCLHLPGWRRSSKPFSTKALVSGGVLEC